MNLCKTSIPRKVTIVMFKIIPVYLKVPQEARVSITRESGGAKLGCCYTLWLGHGGRNGERVPWFFYNHSTLWNHCLMRLQCSNPPFWTRDKSAGREALEQTEQPNKDCRRFWAFFVYIDQCSSSIFQTFFVLWGINFFCQNRTCCLSRVCCMCDFWERGNWRTNDASSANR